MASRLVDFHCHLDLYPDHESIVEQCERERVFTLAVTTTPKAWPRNEELTAPTRHVRSALGLHPQLIGERANEIGLWEELLPRTRYVGEVGLDAGPRFYKNFDTQKAIFARILERCAAARNKVLTIHSVRSAKIVLDMIEKHMPPSSGKAVLHWFTGSASEARRAVDLGCYFSINAEMLTDDKRRSLVLSLPRNRLLTETDGPFTRRDDRPTHPRDVSCVIESLADLFDVPGPEVESLVIANLKTLLVPEH